MRDIDLLLIQYVEVPTQE